jgi:site-specific recombinase XerD
MRVLAGNWQECYSARRREAERMARGQKGAGSVFQRTYRDAHGRKKRTNNWYIEYVVGGRTIREPTEYTKRSDAIEFLKKRVADGLSGKIVLSNQVTFDDLTDLIVNDYRNNRRKSLRHLEQVRLPKLADVFAGTKAIDITTAAVERYKSLRLTDGAAAATLNRELAALKRMHRLGLRHGLVATMPYISLLTEHNVRKGFFEWDQFREILKHLPAEYRALFEVAYITGWRIKSELLTRQWRHIEFTGKGWLRLEPGEAKDETAGREFQFTTWMREVLERQRRFVSQIERRKRIVIPWVFCRADGREMRAYYKAWRAACKTAGIERIPHDFRRTAVRNFERAGVPRTTAMAMVGHKTESIYRRYSIVDQAMLDAGASKLDQLQQAQGLSKPVVVVIRRTKRAARSEGKG